MLLAEANQWPEDAAAYFGDGDECHMNFHFPLMPRLFMAVRMEDRFPHPGHPGADAGDPGQLPVGHLPPEPRRAHPRDGDRRGAGLHVPGLRRDPTARINLGIRRRLAPLLGNNRRKIELLNSCLLSLPGTPVLYYGDEIGMGDNFYLGDRHGVRTPMQWSGDRNAGFSTANPQKLFLPVIIDPEYHYEAVNVEAQHRNPSSLLWWMRSHRPAEAVQGVRPGDLEWVPHDNPKVLAFLRSTTERRSWWWPTSPASPRPWRSFPPVTGDPYPPDPGLPRVPLVLSGPGGGGDGR
jgi:maltose alpha-D-glucosyltransferase / alpha-amylase